MCDTVRTMRIFSMKWPKRCDFVSPNPKNPRCFTLFGDIKTQHLRLAIPVAECMSVVDSTLPFSASFTEVIPPATKKSMNGTLMVSPNSGFRNVPFKTLVRNIPPLGVQLKSTKKILLGTKMCIHDYTRKPIGGKPQRTWGSIFKLKKKCSSPFEVTLPAEI